MLSQIPCQNWLRIWPRAGQIQAGASEYKLDRSEANSIQDYWVLYCLEGTFLNQGSGTVRLQSLRLISQRLLNLLKLAVAGPACGHSVPFLSCYLAPEQFSWPGWVLQGNNTAEFLFSALWTINGTENHRKAIPGLQRRQRGCKNKWSGLI